MPRGSHFETVAFVKMFTCVQVQVCLTWITLNLPPPPFPPSSQCQFMSTLWCVGHMIHTGVWWVTWFMLVATFVSLTQVFLSQCQLILPLRCMGYMDHVCDYIHFPGHRCHIYYSTICSRAGVIHIEKWNKIWNEVHCQRSENQNRTA